MLQILRHKLRFRLCTKVAVDQAFRASCNQFIKKLDPKILQPYLTPDNLHRLAPLVAVSPLPLYQKGPLLTKMSQLSKLDTDGDIRTSSYLKYHLSLHYLRAKDLPAARSNCQQALETLHLLKSKPFGWEVGKIYLQMAEIQFASQKFKEVGATIKTALELFEKGYRHKLEAKQDPTSAVLMLMHCFTRLAWMNLTRKDYRATEIACHQARKVLDESGFIQKFRSVDEYYPKDIGMLEQIECTVMNRTGVDHQTIIDRCKSVISNKHTDPPCKYFMISLAEHLGVKDYKQVKETVEQEIRKRLGEQNAKKYFDMVYRNITMKVEDSKDRKEGGQVGSNAAKNEKGGKEGNRKVGKEAQNVAKKVEKKGSK